MAKAAQQAFGRRLMGMLAASVTAVVVLVVAVALAGAPGGEPPGARRLPIRGRVRHLLAPRGGMIIGALGVLLDRPALRGVAISVSATGPVPRSRSIAHWIPR